MVKPTTSQLGLFPETFYHLCGSPILVEVRRDESKTIIQAQYIGFKEARVNSLLCEGCGRIMFQSDIGKLVKETMPEFPIHFKEYKDVH